MKKLLLATAFVSLGTAGFSETMQPKMSPEEFVSISTQAAPDVSPSAQGALVIAIIIGAFAIVAGGGSAAPLPN